MNDFRLAVRSLGRQPLIVAAVVLTVGLAVAANAALFSIFDGLIFRPLPYRDAARIVHVEVPTETRRIMAPEDFRTLTAALVGTPTLVDRFEARPTVLFEDGAADVSTWGLRPATVTPGALERLGVVPVAGRHLDRDDVPRAGEGPRGAAISEDLWRARFGADPARIGQLINLPGVILRRPIRLVGVLPRGFSFPDAANLWVVSEPVNEHFDFAFLAPGVTIEQAASALPQASVTALREHVRPDGALALGVLLAATALLLLVAWVQVAALLFTRAAGRAGEVGVRLALGASRARLLRQGLAESAVVAGAAMVVALVLTPVLTEGAVRLLPEAMTRGHDLVPDWRTLAFGAIVSAVGVVLLSLVPAEIVRRSAPVTLLRGTAAGGAHAGAGRLRFRLLASQLAITATLLYAAALASGSASAIDAAPLGFDPQRVLAVQMPPTTLAGTTPAERRAHLDRVIARQASIVDEVAAVPGVTYAGGGTLPFYSSILSGGAAFPVTVPGRAPILVHYNPITPDYVRVLRLAMIDGRVPDVAELGGESMVLVNQAMARELGADGPVVGRRLEANRRTHVVVGVFGDFVSARPDRPVEPMVAPLQRAASRMVLVRVADDADEAVVSDGIAAVFARVFPENPPREVMSLPRLAERAVLDYRSRAVLLAIVGGLCVPLALVGIAGATSEATLQRRREIGIRLALGAGPRDVRRDVVGRALRVGGVGLAWGLVGGALMGRWMSAYLFGVGVLGIVPVVGTALLIAIVTYGAAVVPAWRAGRTSPAAALRDA